MTLDIHKHQVTPRLWTALHAAIGVPIEKQRQVLSFMRDPSDNNVHFKRTPELVAAIEEWQSLKDKNPELFGWT